MTTHANHATSPFTEEDTEALPRVAARIRTHPKLGLNLTSMIDVVFLLLVYFMAATDFKRGEEIYRLDLPQLARTADPFDLPRDPLRIRVSSTAAGGSHGYVVRIVGNEPDTVSFDQLHTFLQSNQRVAGGLGGLFEPDHPIVVEPAAATRWEHAMDVFNAAARARYTNVTFAAPR